MEIGKKILIVISIFIALSFQQKDRFIGKVVAQFEPDGRKMTLLEDFSYIDPTGKKWTAKKGTMIDGASIPQIFWSIIGGPYEDNYRNASVVHDYYCEKPGRETWQNVHRMFYDACITGGVSTIKAKIMYAAVYAGGPRWNTTYLKSSKSKPFITKRDVNTSKDKLEGISRWIEEANPDLTKINDTLNQIVVDPPINE